MNSLIKLKEHLKLLSFPTIINAVVYLDNRGDICRENWGDDINYYFIKEISKRPILILGQCSIAYHLHLRNFMVIGSIIDMLTIPNSEVWGAGIIDGNKPLPLKPKKVHAVRGPLTRQKLLSEGVDCPEVYGDPAMLISMYYKPNIKPMFRYGIISHVLNNGLLESYTMDGKRLVEHPNVCIINMRSYNSWTDIVDQICSCEVILSASLHGLIMAEAYKIPNIWIEFGKSLIGGHFKFHDFFLSINRDREKPWLLPQNMISSDIDRWVNVWEPGSIDLSKLIETCPFPIYSPSEI
ncbi:MAG: polysaccharide pyruvyl transferase family protein [Bacteroides sp.]|nr:polysaccharide pyruvyl transferase family protein [Bacteroides sp.]